MSNDRKKPPPPPLPLDRRLFGAPMTPQPPSFSARPDNIGALVAAVARMEAHISRLEERFESQSQSIRALGLAERELSTTKKIAGAALALVIPVILSGVAQAVRIDERQRATELAAGNAMVRAEAAQRAAENLGAEVAVLTAEVAQQRKTTERLLDTIDRFETRRFRNDP